VNKGSKFRRETSVKTLIHPPKSIIWIVQRLGQAFTDLLRRRYCLHFGLVSFGCSPSLLIEKGEAIQNNKHNRIESGWDHSGHTKSRKLWSLRFSHRLQYSEAIGFDELDVFNISENM